MPIQRWLLTKGSRQNKRFGLRRGEVANAGRFRMKTPRAATSTKYQLEALILAQSPNHLSFGCGMIVQCVACSRVRSDGFFRLSRPGELGIGATGAVCLIYCPRCAKTAIRRMRRKATLPLAAPPLRPARANAS